MADVDGDSMNMNPEKNRKLFLGGLNYITTEDVLRSHFKQFGELVDVVVIRFPDTKRSRGFGFITFEQEAEAEACFAARPHLLDGNEVEMKWATPKEETRKEEEGREPESHRKVFVGGLSYDTTNETLKEHFEQFGELVDVIVMRFHDTKRSRGFGFVTYASTEMVDACQAARPHTVDGTKVETKRATPKDESAPAGRGADLAVHPSDPVKKIFIGGVKDYMSDDDIREYFEQFGKVTAVEQMTEKSTGKKRGFGFVEFDDFDAVDKLVLQPRHEIKNWRIDVKKAISKSEMTMRDGGGRRGGRGDRGRDDRGGAPSPWGQGQNGYGGRGGSDMQSYGGFGNSGGFSGSWGGGGNQMSPWQDNFSSQGSSWEEQGNGGWGFGRNNSGAENGRMGGGGGGGPMRQSMGGGGRSDPYSVGGRGGGGGFARGGGGGYARGGGGGRW